MQTLFVVSPVESEERLKTSGCHLSSHYDDQLELTISNTEEVWFLLGNDCEA